MSVVNFTPCAV